MGGFEGWDKTIRAAMVWAGAADPYETRKRVQQTSDQDRDDIREFLAAWYDEFGEMFMTVGAAIKAAANNVELEVALGACCGSSSNLDALKIGKWMGKNVDRIVGGFVLKKDESVAGSRSKRSKHWRVTLSGKQ